MSDDRATADNLDLTALINAAREGDRNAADRALGETYQQLRILARRVRSSDSADRGPSELTPTELLHEAWFRLFPGGSAPELASRVHFMNLAARAMRQVLVDLARERSAQKRGGDWIEVTLNTGLSDGDQAPNLIALDQALQRLERRDPRLVRIVEAYYFAGLSFAETGEALGISERSVRRGWDLARAFLVVALGDSR